MFCPQGGRVYIESEAAERVGKLQMNITPTGITTKSQMKAGMTIRGHHGNWFGFRCEDTISVFYF